MKGSFRIPQAGLHLSILEFLVIDNERLIPQQGTTTVANIDDIEAYVSKREWDIGRIIVVRQEKHGWGQGVVERLAIDLTEMFKGFEGFSSNNLWRMRNFYLAYKGSPKLAQLVQEIPWGQNIVILQMVKDAKEREYYMRATAQLTYITLSDNIITKSDNGG